MTSDIRIAEQYESTLIDRFYLKCLRNSGFSKATPIQYYSLKEGLNRPESLICQSKSGTGKTLAYLSLLMSELFNLAPIESKTYQLVLCPTRQLAIQVYQVLKQLLQSANAVKAEDEKEKKVKQAMRNLNAMLSIGGIPFEDDKKKYLQHGAHIIIGTVGRIHQLFSKQILPLNAITTLSLDEGDKLYENSTSDFATLLSATGQARLLIYSATYSQKLLDQLQIKRKFIFIRTLALNGKLDLKIIKNQKITIQTEGEEQNNQMLSLQNIYKFQIGAIDLHNSSIFNAKVQSLIKILRQTNYNKCLIFVEKKVMLPQIAERLAEFDPILIHGSLSQAARIRLMNQMVKSKVILASDLLARGIDFMLDLVVLFDAKQNDTFWHRIGRTGRFGRSGVAISLEPIGWDTYDRQKVNRILEEQVKLEQKKEYYGKYLSDLSEWAEVNEQTERELKRGYKYFSEEQLLKSLLESPREQSLALCKNTAELTVPQQFGSEACFQDYVKKLLSCQHCVGLIKETQQLTGYRFELLKYFEKAIDFN